MFNCIKTGFYGRLPSGNFLYGDAFAMNGTNWPEEAVRFPVEYLLLRVTSLSCEKPSVIHIDLRTWSHWFEENAGDVVSPAPDLDIIWRPSSTLIASPGQWSWCGYDGEPA